MTTVGYALRRLGISILLLLLLSFLTFSLYKAIPANPAGFLVDMQKATPDQIAKAEAALDLHDSFFKQYGDYLWRLVHGDLGIAYQGTTLTPDGSRVGTPVGPVVVRAALVTGSLVIGGALLALLISIPLGAIAAAKPRSATDRSILAVSLIGICTHPLVVALLLQQFAGNQWGIAPARGYCSFFGTVGEPGKFDGFSLSQDLGCAGPTAWASHLILPWITFALFFVGIYTRLVRVWMIEVMDEPYIRTAEAKGMPRARRPPSRVAQCDEPGADARRHGHRSGTRDRALRRVGLPSPRPRADDARGAERRHGLRPTHDSRRRARDRARDRGRQLHHRPRHRVDGPRAPPRPAREARSSAASPDGSA